MKQLFFGFCLG
ncbi:Putative uncharacterized protein [Lacticaseibacillus paracasei]|nr:Putative uncharacterized protein [Lacticaseibacillus paracasei]